MSREHPLLGVQILSQANRIASAQLTYQDGAASGGGFPLCDADTFAPGAEVEVLAGTPGEEESLFTGVVVRQSLKLRERSGARLIVDCRHPAYRMTLGRGSGYFHDQTDAEIMSALIEDAGMRAEVEDTPLKHAHMVQFDCTPWDLLLARARANGLLVFPTSEGLSVAKPVTDGEPALELLFGATLLELDLQLDARGQFGEVRCASWDPATQEPVDAEGSDPALGGPGDLDSAALADSAGLEERVLRHGAVSEEEAKAWAEAEWLHAQLGRVRGMLSCEGVGLRPGELVTLSGVGARFSGTAYVTGVRHDLSPSRSWRTHVQVGEVGELPSAGVSTPPAAGLVPAVAGLQIGVVVSNEDPEGEYRVRVTLPVVQPDDDGAWARVAALDAGDGRGALLRPEVGDEVVVGFLHDDPRLAVVLGMLHSSAKAAPIEPSDDNHQKAFVSRSGVELLLDDEAVSVKLSTPGGASLLIDDDQGLIELVDQNGNSVTLSGDGVRIESASALDLVGVDVKVEASAGLEGSAGAELKLDGGAGAELTSSAVTTIKGSLVKIN